MPETAASSDLSQVITSVVIVLVMGGLFTNAAGFLILLERKVCAWVQDRIGPNRVGPLGLLQPAADGIKLFVKEEFMPRGADKVLFILAPGLAIIPAVIAFAVIPWGGVLELSTVPLINATGTVTIIGADINIGIIYLVAATSLGVYGVSIGGWASNNKYSFIGGLRASAQMISYEIPMGLTLLAVILTAGSVYGMDIVGAQMTNGWFILHLPIAAIIFYTCMLAEGNRAPFDLAEAEQELVGGWHTEYSSMKWAMFFLGEYVHMIVGGAFFTMLFLGGWSVSPFGLWPDLPTQGGLGLILLQVAIVLGKTFCLIFLTMMIRWTLPRFRFDQLMRLAWEGMIPASMLVLLVTSFVVFLGLQESWMWAGSLLTFVIIWLAYPHLPKQSNPNHRVPLIGSRFSPVRERDAAGAPIHPMALDESAVASPRSA